MFELANKWVLFLLPLPFLVWYVLPAMRQRNSSLIAPFAERIAEASGQQLRKSSWIQKRNMLQWILLLLAWVCFLSALARPQIIGQPEMKVKTARSFLVAADISFSMAARDWVVDGKRQSRWEALKQVMREFIKRREGDRMGLVFFGTNAYLQTPFTTNLDVVDWFLEETEVGMAGQMTSIGRAIGFGIRMFEQDTIDQKVMLLLTDGSDGGKGVTPLDAAYMAKKDSIKIYTIGIGDPEAPGSDLDEETLKQISDITGGQYFRAINQQQLEKAYQLLDELEPMEFEEEENKPVTELYFYPLTASLLLAYSLLFLRGLVSILKNRNNA